MDSNGASDRDLNQHPYMHGEIEGGDRTAKQERKNETLFGKTIQEHYSHAVMMTNVSNYPK